MDPNGHHYSHCLGVVANNSAFLVVSAVYTSYTSTKFKFSTRRLEKQRRVGAAKPLDPGDTGRRYSSGTVPLFSTGSGPYS